MPTVQADTLSKIAKGLLLRLDVEVDWPGRPIGITLREGWVPTPAQALLLDTLRRTARAL